MKRVFEEPEIEIVKIIDDIICFSTDLDEFDDFGFGDYDTTPPGGNVTMPLDP